MKPRILDWRPSILIWGTLAVIFVLPTAMGDIYSSLVGLEHLLNTEQKVMIKLKEYIQMEEQRLQALKEYAESRTEPDWLSRFEMENMGNPVDAYKLIKRAVQLTSESILNLVTHDNSKELVSLFRIQAEKASDVDLDGAAKAIFRIMDTYKLKAPDLAQGRVPGAQNKTPLNSDDCFHLGYSASQHSDFYHAIPWLLETKERMIEEDKLHINAADSHLRSYNLSLLYDYLAFALYEQGNFEWAVWFGRQLRDLEPTYPAVDNLEVYEGTMKNLSSKWDGTELSLPRIRNIRDLTDVYTDYEALCRGEIYLTERQRKKLVCYYKKNRPFLKLAPLKVELLFRDPDIYFFYDAVSDAEADVLKQLASPQLQRAMVVKSDEDLAVEADTLVRAQKERMKMREQQLDKDDEANMVADYRIAKNMWLHDSDHPVVETLSRRVEDMTDLDLKSAEHLQIANYGLGGHYEPHFDMTTEPNSNNVYNEDNGNRIATVLFYLTQQVTGGATVFEEINIGAFPRKNGAVFWHNLFKNGKPDMLTRHGACPVLYGQKWIANKWIHEYNNEFVRPCGLTEDETEKFPFEDHQPHLKRKAP